MHVLFIFVSFFFFGIILIYPLASHEHTCRWETAFETRLSCPWPQQRPGKDKNCGPSFACEPSRVCLHGLHQTPCAGPVRRTANDLGCRKSEQKVRANDHLRLLFRSTRILSPLDGFSLTPVPFSRSPPFLLQSGQRKHFC